MNRKEVKTKTVSNPNVSTPVKKSISWSENCNGNDFKTRLPATPYPQHHAKKRKLNHSVEYEKNWKIITYNKPIKPDKRNNKNWIEKNLLLEPEASGYVFDPTQKLARKVFQNLEKMNLNKKEIVDFDNLSSDSFDSNLSIAGSEDEQNLKDLNESVTNKEKTENFHPTFSSLHENTSEESSNENDSKIPILLCREIQTNNSNQTNLFDKCFNGTETNNDIDIFESFASKKFDQNSCEIIVPLQNRAENDSLPNGSSNESTSEIIENVQTDQTYVSVENVKEIENFVKFHRCKNYTILHLKHPLKLYFHGKLSVKVLIGRVEILGFELNSDYNNCVEMYSPRGNSFLCIQTVSSIDLGRPVNLLKTHDLTHEEIEALLTDWSQNDCLLIVKNIRNDFVSYVEKHVAQQLFPNMNLIENQFEKQLQCLFQIEPIEWNVFKPMEELTSIVNDYVLNENESRVLLCGGKGVGKSTALRFMVNRLLNYVEKVVCIDLDPGQSEFTIGGCVSVTIVDAPLFGPNYTHLKKPLKSFFVGDTNVTQCLNRYMSSVKNLLSYCEQHLDKNIPWIINYLGFTRSIGTDLVVSVIRLFCPTVVIQIQSNNNYLNYASHLDVNYVQNYETTVLHTDRSKRELNYRFKCLDSVAEEKAARSWEYEPRQIREMSILSYFSGLLKGKPEITDLQPYVVQLSALKLQHVDYNKENINAVLNGNLVALSSENTKIPSCIGFGIVRGIDQQNDKLYLLTPVLENELEMVDCLTMGNIALPPSLYMTPGCEGLVPFVSAGVPKRTSLAPKRTFRPLKALIKKN